MHGAMVEQLYGKTNKWQVCQLALGMATGPEHLAVNFQDAEGHALNRVRIPPMAGLCGDGREARAVVRPQGQRRTWDEPRT